MDEHAITLYYLLFVNKIMKMRIYLGKGKLHLLWLFIIWQFSTTFLQIIRIQLFFG
jgi:hypothetical protein